MNNKQDKNGFPFIGPIHKPWRCPKRCGLMHRTKSPRREWTYTLDEVLLDALIHTRNAFRKDRLARGDVASVQQVSYNTRPDQPSVPTFKGVRYLGSLTTTQRLTAKLAGFGHTRPVRVGRVCGEVLL